MNVKIRLVILYAYNPRRTYLIFIENNPGVPYGNPTPFFGGGGINHALNCAIQLIKHKCFMDSLVNPVVRTTLSQQ